MLEIRNITKVYRSKTGEQVKALDNVSIQFPESGMVFVLGKSGSGKSTLLNVIGGLDSCDSGEFVIMGKSSKDFAGSDFDAYRNTFIGFIFQEYNILEDFTVGANIGLALELQGKKATSEAITGILSQVDLVGYASRKPNELSGGQKQRVAIARALVKEPQIIMADEPTGALDSNTGKQIFDALKELSREKLVLVVSHDRDFAERYADRIIEMSDGRVIEDVTKHTVEAERVSEGVQRMGKSILRIEKGYQLTAKDLELINAYLRDNEQEVLLSGDGRVNDELRSAAGITKDGSTAMFESTAPEKDVKVKEYDGKKPRFIRSRLPMKNALRIGASSLKHKTFRLVLTILLSLVAFGMFGLADTMAAYDKITAATESILDSNLRTAAFTLGVRSTYYYEDEVRHYYNNGDYTFNEQDIATLREQTGLAVLPVFNGNYSSRSKISYTSHFDARGESHDAYPGSLSGFVSMESDKLGDYGFTLEGKLPTADNEIAITEHTYRQFREYGFKNEELDERVEAGKLTKTQGDANSILGKHLTLSIGNNAREDYVIVGVVDTHFDYDRYASFLPQENQDSGLPEQGTIIEMFFADELQTTLSYDFHCLAFLKQSEIDSLAQSMPRYYREFGTYIYAMQVYLSRGDVEWNENFGWTGNMQHIGTVAKSDALSQFKITWLDGTPRTTLGAKEIVVSAYALSNLMSDQTYTFDFSAIDELATQRYGEHYTNTDKEWSYASRLANAIDSYLADKNGQWPNEAQSAAEWAAVGAHVAELFDIELPSDLTDAEIRFVIEPLLQNFNSAQTEYNKHDFIWRRSCAAAAIDILEKGLLQNDAFLDAMLDFWGMKDQDLPDDWDTLSDIEKIHRFNLQDAYYNWLMNMGRDKNEYSNLTGSVLESESNAALFKAANVDFTALYSEIKLNAMTYSYKNGSESQSPWMDFSDWKIVGTYDGDQSNLLISDDFYDRYVAYAKQEGYSIQETANHENGIYAFALAPMARDNDAVEQLVTLHFEEQGDTTFYLQNHVMHTLSSFNSFIEEGAQIFLWVGLGFAVFSSLLLMNFIAISISYKKREIGILRAVGARSSDVFKIFFSEALMIALINFVLAVVAVVVAIFALNRWMRGEGINVTLLTFGLRQIALMLGVSVGVALLSSFLPVYKIARRKPVDAIKDR